MKRCILDGAALSDASAVYRVLADAFVLPDYFGNNPDALWDALDEYAGQPVEVAWRNADVSAARIGRDFDRIVAALKKAEAAGRLVLRFSKGSG